MMLRNAEAGSWPAIRALARVVPLVCALGCAAQAHIRRGDTLLKNGSFDAAIAAYEEALRHAPDNAQALEGIRHARVEAVRDQLVRAHRALKEGDYAGGLRAALQARRMPLDLEEVGLVRRIDDLIDQASRGAEKQVADAIERGQFVPAVELATRVEDASPGVASRKQWADDVRARAQRHHSQLADELVPRQLYGSAAIQWALARYAGADVGFEQVVTLWDRFTETICFGTPEVSVEGRAGDVASLRQSIVNALQQRLDGLRSRCGEGTRLLGLRVELENAVVRDDTNTTSAATALPGSGVQTTETYEEEVPYTVVEKVTEHEMRTELLEKRDCAPRPGQERGCRTWTEEVQVQVPVVRERTVEKLRRVQRTRPAKGPFPADKVVQYKLTVVDRQIEIHGTIEVRGEVALPLHVSLVAQDSGHPAVAHPRMDIAEDPLEAKSMESLHAEAVRRVSEEGARALAAAIKRWTIEDAQIARQRVLEGRLPEAEERYLRLVALGIDDDPQLLTFFKDRYGRDLATVMRLLRVAMGAAEARGANDSRASALFPKRGARRPDATLEPVTPEEQPAQIKVPQRAPAPAEKPPDVSPLASDELRALEEASLADASRPEEANATDTNRTEPAEPSAAPARQPVAPK